MISGLHRVAESDCEHIGRGLLAQPANTLSSLAYVLSGMMLLWSALAGRPIARLAPVVYAVTVIDVGIRSAAFHGPMPAWGRFAHDLSIAAVLAFVIGYDVAFARRSTVSAGLAVFGGLAGACAVVLALWPDTGNALGRTDAPLCEPEAPVQLHAVWHVLTAFVLFLYGTAVLGPREQARPKIRA